MKRRTVSIAAGAAAFVALSAPAAAGSYDYAGLGHCAPDVSSITIDPTGAAVSFAVPDGCAAQRWRVVVDDYRGNAGHALPAEGRGRLVDELVTGSPVEWTWSAPHHLCGGQVDLILDGQEQPYAAAVFEAAGCEDVGTTATPPPAPDQTPPGVAPSVEGVADSGGGTGADTSVATEATAGPAPLVEIATPQRVGALPATLPQTGFSGQLLVIGVTSLGVGVLACAGSALEGRSIRRGRKADR